jgi:hypothetical protein
MDFLDENDIKIFEKIYTNKEWTKMQFLY